MGSSKKTLEEQLNELQNTIATQAKELVAKDTVIHKLRKKTQRKLIPRPKGEPGRRDGYNLRNEMKLRRDGVRLHRLERIVRAYANWHLPTGKSISDQDTPQLDAQIQLIQKDVPHFEQFQGGWPIRAIIKQYSIKPGKGDQDDDGEEAEDLDMDDGDAEDSGEEDSWMDEDTANDISSVGDEEFPVDDSGVQLNTASWDTEVSDFEEPATPRHHQKDKKSRSFDVIVRLGSIYEPVTLTLYRSFGKSRQKSKLVPLFLFPRRSNQAIMRMQAKRLCAFPLCRKEIPGSAPGAYALTRKICEAIRDEHRIDDNLREARIRGWDLQINFADLPNRVLALDESLLDLVYHSAAIDECPIWHEFLRQIPSKSMHSPARHFSIKHLNRRSFGSKGQAIIFETITDFLDDTVSAVQLHSTIGSLDDTQWDQDPVDTLLTNAHFIHHILAPLAATLLISDDFNTNFASAHSIMLASSDYGDMFNFSFSQRSRNDGVESWRFYFNRLFSPTQC
ncbi:hypothetical protein B0H14DRAFT_3588085 [Mycena olivaceomarginata]|nr:hypothetical protein B0H14DRAFT_3588085 [Mycena olivaceomarginata]